MKPVNLIVWGRHLVTDPAQLPAAGLIEQGGVAIADDRVVEVGTHDELFARYPYAERMGSEGALVFPGLVNTHHHGWGLSNYQMGAADEYLELWLSEIWSRRPVDAYADSLWADMRNIRSGVTTVLHGSYPRDFSKYASDIRAKLRAHDVSGIRAAFAVHVLDRNTFVYQDDAEFLKTLPTGLRRRVTNALDGLGLPGSSAFFELARTLAEEYDGHRRISILAGPVAGQWCSDELLKRVRSLADEMGTGIAIHCVESAHQREWALRTYGKTQAQHFEDMGLLGPDVSLGHAGWLTERDMEICAAAGTSVCHNPSSNLRLRVGILPAIEMLAKGVNVSIGLDGNGLNDDEDMLQELRLAAKLHRLPRALEFHAPPTSFDLLKMGTVNGARSTNLDGDIGRLKPGYKADVVVLDTKPMLHPYQDDATHIVDVMLQRAKGVDVDSVVIDGTIVLRDKKFTTVDEQQVMIDLVNSATREPSPQIQAWMDAAAELKPFMVRFYKDWEAPCYQPGYTVNSPKNPG